jgi:hypothetical protein
MNVSRSVVVWINDDAQPLKSENCRHWLRFYHNSQAIGLCAFFLNLFQVALSVQNGDYLQRDGFGAADNDVIGELPRVQKRTGSLVMSCRLVPMRGCLASRRQAAMPSISTRGGVPLPFRDGPPTGIKVFSGLRR